MKEIIKVADECGVTYCEVGRDIHVYRNLIDNPTEARIDEEAAYLLNFEKAMLKKYNM